jgi:ribosome-associated toxin RatA of RatAB toxin-antitoxin module
MSSYPRFVPYCKGVSIITPPKVVGPGNTTEEEASMTAGFLGFTETYTSRVTCKPYDSVEVSFIYYYLVCCVRCLSSRALTGTLYDS